MIISVGTRRASILEEELTASFNPIHLIRESMFSKSSHANLRQVRSIAEILRSGGGMMPRALLGGAFVPSVADELVIEVRTSGQSSTGTPSCESQLWRSLVPGLPDEFARSALDGLIRHKLPAGRVVIDRGAFDPVESSPSAFGLAADVLATVFHATSMGEDVEQAVRDSIGAWS